MNADKIADFMLEEYKQIANAYQDLHAQHNELVRSYLTLVALPVTVLSVAIKVLGTKGANGEDLLPGGFGLLLPTLVLFMVALCVVGYAVFRALVSTRAEAILYVRTVNVVRRFFEDHASDVDLGKYLVLPGYDHRMPPFKEGPETRAFWNIVIVQALNAVIATVTGLAFVWWLDRELKDYVKPFVHWLPTLLSDSYADAKWMIPCSLGLVYLFFQLWQRDRSLSRAEQKYKPKFNSLAPSKVIGVDLDGVLADLAEGVIKKLNSLFSIRVTREHITSHNIEECLGVSGDQVRAIFSSEDIFVNLAPVSGAKEAIQRLRERGWYVHIVTDRFSHENDWSVSRDWLTNNGFRWEHLDLVRAREKPAYARIHGIRYFIEDNVDTARALASVCERVFLINEPYNQGSVPENVVRVGTWLEVVSCLS